MNCCSTLANTASSSPKVGSSCQIPVVKKPSSKQQQQPEEEEAAEPLLTLRSPLDPETEYRLVWAKQSLWKRRLEGLQQRYPSDKSLDCDCDSSDDDDDDECDATYIMDTSQMSYNSSSANRWGESSSNRWGDSSCRSLPLTVSRVFEENEEDDDKDDMTVSSCPPRINRWGDNQESITAITSTSSSTRSSNSAAADSQAPPSRPSRRVSFQEEEEDSECESHSSAAYAVTWLDGLYSTVRDVRRDGLCSKIQDIRRTRSASLCE